MKNTSWTRLLAATLIATSAGCAAMPPAKAFQVADVKQLAGKWTGWVTSPQGNASAEVTVSEDGQFVALFGPQQASGTVNIRDGKADFAAPTVTGTLSLYERDGKLLVRVDGRLIRTSSMFSGELTK